MTPGELEQVWLASGESLDGHPNIVVHLCSFISSMEIRLREEEFTHDEAIQLIAAWLQGGCPT